MLTTIQKEQFEKDWDAFLASHPEGLLYKTQDDDGKWTLAEVHPKLRKLTEAYVTRHSAGVSSVSSFEIVLRLLVEEGDFKPIGVEKTPPVSNEIVEFVERYEAGRVSVFEFRRAYMSNRALRDYYDRHTGLATLASQPVTLTVEQYRAMPSAVLQKRYKQEPVFAAAVDALHSSGRV